MRSTRLVRSLRLPLLWRVFAVNAGLLVLATALLLFTPVTVSEPIALVEALILVASLLLMIALNLLLLRPLVAPLDTLVRRMNTVDLLRPGQRLPEDGGPETRALVRAFNQMLDRLEEERRESGRRALAAQEAERRRIALGLHDEVGQVLTGVLLQLDTLAAPGSPERADDVAETKQAVRQALEEVRRIARELRPEMLEQLGLVSALTELSTKFAQQSGLDVRRRFAPSLPPLSRDVELAIYRVAQESLTNVARHARASTVEISLEPGAGSVVLCISDDGSGLAEAAVDGHGGLRGMRERAVLVGGALAVHNGRRGVQVRLEVPAESG
jgi:two-component system sensor histidine kinase UhpB